MQFKMNGTLKDMVGFERFPGIWKYWLIQTKRIEEERNKNYKKTNNDGMLRNTKICATRTTQNQRVESCPPEESGVLALFEISYL